MYSPKVTAQQVQRAERATQRKDLKFKVRRCEVDECLDFVEKLAGIWDGQCSAPTRELTAAEQRHIKSELILCRWDLHYWLERYHYILSWDGQRYVRMEPNVAQKIILDIFAECEEKQIAISLQVLKARQLGITTLMEAVVEHRTMFHPNTRAIVGSAQPDKSTKMVGMCEASWERTPWWMMPTKTQSKIGELAVFGALGSQLSIRHGAQKQTDVGRGETPNVVHLSECCEWTHPEDDIDAGLLFAMHPNPMMMLVLESSAGVIKDWWNKTWTLNKQRWGDPYNPAKLRPIFLPWYVGVDIYPTEAELRQNPIPPDWSPSILTLQQAERAKEYVVNTPLLHANLGAKWIMPREQQWYYEHTRSYYKANDALNIFLREMASNDVECFNSKYSSVFDAEVISNYLSGARPPVRIYALDGPEQDIRPELKPDYRERDPNFPLVTIDKIYTLVPLKMTGYPNHINPEGRIFVYELPSKDNLYGLGIDTSKGMGQDSSCVEIIRKATIDRVPAQVCEFAHSQISAHDLPPWTHCLARYYTVEVAGDSTQPKLAIDTSNGGDATQLAMVKLGWSNFHNWIRYDKKRINEGKANFMGFVMVEWARDMVVGTMVKSLRDLLIDIFSPWFIEEMSTMEKNEEKVRIEAARGNHDDRFFAMGMIITSMHALDMGSLRSSFGKSAAALQVEDVVPQFPTQPTGQSWAERANKPPDDTMTKSEFDWSEVVKQAVEDDQRTAPFFEESYGNC